MTSRVSMEQGRRRTQPAPQGSRSELNHSLCFRFNWVSPGSLLRSGGAEVRSVLPARDKT